MPRLYSTERRERARRRRSTPRGNRHFNARRPDGPLCTALGCDAPFRPICPNPRCSSRRVVLGMIRAERMVGSRLFPGHPDYQARQAKPKRATVVELAQPIVELVPRAQLEALRRRFQDRAAA